MNTQSVQPAKLPAKFWRFWLSQSVSMLGTVISRDTLPIIAVMLLSATPWDMSVLVGAKQLASMLLGLYAGVYLARARLVSALVWLDILQFVLLLIIPISWYLQMLNLTLLSLIGFATGACTSFSSIGSRSLVPNLVSSKAVLNANSKLSLSDAITESLGSSLTGLLIQLLSAPLVILLDCLSYLLSAFLLRPLLKDEQSNPLSQSKPQGFYRSLILGLTHLKQQKLLYRLLCIDSGLSLLRASLATLYVLYALNYKGFTPLSLGLVISAGALGALLGAILVKNINRFFSLASIISSCIFINALCVYVMTSVNASFVWIFIAYFLTQVLGDACDTIKQISQTSRVQQVTDSAFLSRVFSVFDALPSVAHLLGIFICGYLAEILGIENLLYFTAYALAALSLYAYVLLRNVKHQ